ncbi:MAG: D-alanyl-D-alanine carboxypeptidase [Lachnospiraceae bacterium]|nr:D-alanyl-D-alanine carboxypeptidase [Lachnospiraceae bacterium]
MGKLKSGKTKGRCRKIFLTVWLSVAVAVVSLWGSMLPADAAGPDITSPSAMVIEASTGQVIYEKNAEERRSPASITKIMTLLIIFDYLENGKVTLEDEVRTSARAQDMGGSQVFLEEGEIQTLDTLIKCIAVASGNDAAVAAAEHVAGSEEEFVYLMNQRAAGLGMENTHFEDCCGLTDSDGHYTSAKDVAIMSRELITKYPKIFDYTGIWMEDITHTTNRGTETFTLSSTNKLLKSYEWATGLKTGSTSKAKFCLSATARKDGMDLIAVVMGAEEGKIRFSEAITLLSYGYSVSHIYEDQNEDILPSVPIKGAIVDETEVTYQAPFRYLDTTGQSLDGVEKIISLPEQVQAPVKAGDVAGEAIYLLAGNKLGSVPIIFKEDVPEAVYKDFVRKAFEAFLLSA